MELLLGTDLVKISRIQDSLERFGQRFADRVYTHTEQQDCWRRSPPPTLDPKSWDPQLIPLETLKRFAGRWAAKEAIVKALGTGWTGVGYTDVAVCRLPSGEPRPELGGRALERLRVLDPEGQGVWRLSMTHDGDYAMATAIALILPPS
ncbi:MAG: holo-ACP synthase [Cyanobacteria bacterium P01_H01_bin.130]